MILHLRKYRLVYAVIVLVFHMACSAQDPTSSTKATLNLDRPAAVAEGAAVGGFLQPGEYITEKGWGRLLIKEQAGALNFRLETFTGEDVCGLHGSIQGNRGAAKSDDGSSVCTAEFTSTPQGIDVAASTPSECRAFCGYNGGFEGSYIRVENGCGQVDLDRTRDAFKRLYDRKEYEPALASLAPVLANCLPILEWEDEAAIRNDLAITQYKNGLYADCLATLGKYAEDAGKEDDAVMEEWPPALANRYLAVVRAARTNIDSCRKGLARE